MSEPAVAEPWEPWEPRTFREIFDEAYEYRRCHGVPEVSEEEAMELALEAQREVRAELRTERIL